ncbi:MAG: hypothetical protein WAM79_10430 [Candidatus Sulfotelmatobacter sp.]
MDISKLNNARHSFLPEIIEKLEKDAPVSDLQRLILQEMTSILAERYRLFNSLKPDQINLRKRETLRSLKLSTRVLMGVRMLGKQINQMHKQREYIDWKGRRLTYVVGQLLELAMECLRKTGQTDHAMKNWAMHYRQQLDERLEEICRAANEL